MLQMNVTILIIDDDSLDRAHYKRILEKPSHLICDIIEAENANDALKILNEKNIDCILLDYQLPDSNGLVLLKEIKDNFGELLPVIMLTGHGDEKIAVTAMKEGAADYLVKDKIDSDIFIKTIVNVIKAARLKKIIQEQKERLEYYAYYDSLTGLINRHTFEELARQAETYAERHQDQLAILLIDLDNFVTINDTLGQLAGDDILIEIANRLKEALPEDAIVGRWGDDEFAVLITGPDISQLSSLWAQTILNEISRPIQLTVELVHMAASIGIACYPDNSEDINKLLKNAYAALIHAKRKGRGNIQHYSEEMK